MANNKTEKRVYRVVTNTHDRFGRTERVFSAHITYALAWRAAEKAERLAGEFLCGLNPETLIHIERRNPVGGWERMS